jgi:transcriptional regulator with XRE-family HTH domain
MLLEEFLGSMGLTQRELAVAIHVLYQRVNEIINSRRGTPMGSSLLLTLNDIFNFKMTMAGLLRIEHPNAWYLIMNRGRRSEQIFYYQ